MSKISVKIAHFKVSSWNLIIALVTTSSTIFPNFRAHQMIILNRTKKKKEKLAHLIDAVMNILVFYL